jgi:hypothetical protein
MCRIPYWRSLSSKSVSPRQAVYCRPWSVRTSTGVPYAAIPRSSASSTSEPFWWCASTKLTMKREWSSMKAVRYSRSCRLKRKVKMSDCQSWFGAARSKRRGGLSPRSTGPGIGGVTIPASVRTRCTVLADTPSASKRCTRSRIRRAPYSGCSCLSAITALATGSERSRSCLGLPALFGTSACSPPSW